MVQRTTGARRIRNLMLGLTIAPILSYFVSSVFRLSAGDPASKAWTPSWVSVIVEVR
jgi:hypothetical protein